MSDAQRDIAHNDSRSGLKSRMILDDMIIRISVCGFFLLGGVFIRHTWYIYNVFFCCSSTPSTFFFSSAKFIESGEMKSHAFPPFAFSTPSLNGYEGSK